MSLDERDQALLKRLAERAERLALAASSQIPMTIICREFLLVRDVVELMCPRNLGVALEAHASKRAPDFGWCSSVDCRNRVGTDESYCPSCVAVHDQADAEIRDMLEEDLEHDVDHEDEDQGGCS